MRDAGYDAPRIGHLLAGLPVLRGMLCGHGSVGAQVLGNTFARDEGEFYDLVVELADYADGFIQMRADKQRVPVREALDDPEKMLKDLVSS
ncbi:hypothetical protein [Streptomyces sp. 3N207]|uniref:hypothetical protein n=1 Tax=Streptomyces sp. 3N207 TaxID=3457417 RepID=UPI003FD656A0